MNLAHDKLVDLKLRMDAPELIDDPHLVTHRDLVRAAANATNGCQDKMAALLELAGMQALVTAEEKLREPEKLKAFFDQYHSAICPVQALITEGPDGKKVMPWEKRKEETDSSVLTGPFGTALKGPVVKYAVTGIFVIAGMWLIINRNDANMKKQIRDSIAPAVASILAERGLEHKAGGPEEEK